MGLHQLISFSAVFLLIASPWGNSLSLFSSLFLFITVSSVSANYTTGKSFPPSFLLNNSLPRSAPCFPSQCGLFLLFHSLFSLSLFIHHSLHQPIPLEICWYGCSSCRPETRRLLGRSMIKETLISSMTAEKICQQTLLEVLQYVCWYKQTTGHAVEQSGIKGRHCIVCNQT